MGIYLKELDFYAALVARVGGIFEARFIDIPDCVGFGGSAIEAEIKAGEALCIHAEQLRKNGRAMPEPGIVSSEANRHDRYIAYIRAPARSTECGADQLGALNEPRSLKGSPCDR